MTALATRVAIAVGRHFRDPKSPANDAALAVLFEDAAKAAIGEIVEAIQEPTEAMLQEARIADYDGLSAIWKAMLKEAVK